MELQDLRIENQRLQEELRQLRGEETHPRHPQPLNSPDPLRLTAAHPGPAPPNVRDSKRFADANVTKCYKDHQRSTMLAPNGGVDPFSSNACFKWQLAGLLAQVSPAQVIPDSTPAVEVIIHGAGGLSEAGAFTKLGSRVCPMLPDYARLVVPTLLGFLSLDTVWTLDDFLPVSVCCCGKLW